MENEKPERGVGFHPSGFFVFRTALLPFHVLLEWVAGLTAIGALDDEALQTAVNHDRAELTGRLKAIVVRPEIREALFVASPSTNVDLIRWLGAGEAHDAKLERTLAKYLQRMAGRATPFGLFGGCSVGRLSDTTNLELVGLTQYRRYSRLDNDYLFALTQYLGMDDETRRAVRYRPNSSLYHLAGRWRYPLCQ